VKEAVAAAPGAAPVLASGAGTRSLAELLTPAIGAFNECIFIHADSARPRMMLAALYPPADSVPEREHDNKTSNEIEFSKITTLYGTMSFRMCPIGMKTWTSACCANSWTKAPFLHWL
jgi:hypothetical protein